MTTATLRGTRRAASRERDTMTTATLPEETRDSITTLDELAWRLLGELSNPEVDALLPVTEAIWDEIKQQLVAFALEVHAIRERYQREHIEPARATP